MSLLNKSVNRVVLTIAPLFVGGLKAIEWLPADMHLKNVSFEQIGKDMIVSGWL